MSVWAVYALLVGASFRSRVQYKRSFVLETLGRGALTGLELLAIVFLFDHIDAIAGWTKWEVIYLFGAGNFALGVAELATSGLNRMPELVRSGELDRVLVRPASTLAQVMAQDADFYNLGRLAQGMLVIIAASWFGEFGLSVLDWLALAGSLICGAGVFAALFITSASTCFWTINSGEAFNAFTYGGVQMVQFPLGVYPRAIGMLFVFMIPVGLALFYPAMAVFGRTDPLGAPAFMPWLAPVAALVSLRLAIGYWRFGMSRFQSTGS